MKEIQLTQGKVAIVDDEDFDRMSQYKWCAHVSRIYVYAVSQQRIKQPDGKTKQYLKWMHREILNCPSGYFVDHIDHNTLNNQKSNLRVSTRSQNCSNNKAASKITGFKGVKNDAGRFRARIVHGGKTFHLGCFSTPELAAAAYDCASIKMHGEFSRNNKMMGRL